MKTGFRLLWVLALLIVGLWSLPISFSSALPFIKSKGSISNTRLVSNPGESVTVNPKFYALNPCEKRQFTATVKDANGEEVKDAKVTWQSTNPAVAKIDEQGIAVAVSPGSTLIKPIMGNVKGEPASLFVRDKGVHRDC